MGLVRMGTLINDLGGGMSVNSEMHLILHLGKEIFGGLCVSVVVQSSGVYICDLLIEYPF